MAANDRAVDNLDNVEKDISSPSYTTLHLQQKCLTKFVW